MAYLLRLGLRDLGPVHDPQPGAVGRDADERDHPRARSNGLGTRKRIVLAHHADTLRLVHQIVRNVLRQAGQSEKSGCKWQTVDGG